MRDLSTAGNLRLIGIDPNLRARALAENIGVAVANPAEPRPLRRRHRTRILPQQLPQVVEIPDQARKLRTGHLLSGFSPEFQVNALVAQCLISVQNFVPIGLGRHRKAAGTLGDVQKYDAYYSKYLQLSFHLFANLTIIS